MLTKSAGPTGQRIQEKNKWQEYFSVKVIEIKRSEAMGIQLEMEEVHISKTLIEWQFVYAKIFMIQCLTTKFTDSDT